MPAQAESALVEIGQHLSAADAQLMPDGMPCHHQAESSPAPDHSVRAQGRLL